MQVQDRISIEGHRLGVVDQQLDGGFVIEDHLRFRRRLSLRRLAVLDQLPRIQQGIGVAFQIARCPRKVDQQPVKYRATISSGRAVGLAGIALDRHLWTRMGASVAAGTAAPKILYERENKVDAHCHCGSSKSHLN